MKDYIISVREESDGYVSAMFDMPWHEIPEIKGCPHGSTHGGGIEAAVTDLLTRTNRESGLSITRFQCIVATR